MDVLEEERLAFAEELEEVALQLSLQDPGLVVEDRVQQVNDEYERLAMAAEMFALPEVSALVNWSQSSLSTPAMPDLLNNGKYFNWLELTALTFREPEEVSHLPLLMAELTDPLWPEPLAPEQLQGFLLSLRPEEGESADEAESASDVERSDNPLSFAADIHPELLAAYMEETPSHVTEAARLIRLLAIGAANDEQRQQAARLAHTLKGSSSVVGVEPIAGFTHRLEDLLEFPLATIAQTEGLGETLEASADCLESMFDNLQDSSGLPDEYPHLHQQLGEWLDRLQDEDGSDEIDDLPDLQQLTELPEFLRSADNESAVSEDVNDDAPGVVEANAPLRLSEDRIQDMLSLTGELITSTSVTGEVLQQTRNLGAQLYQQDEQIRQRLDELDGLVDQQKQHNRSGAAGDAKISLKSQSAQPDDLELESYSDLYSTTSLLTEAAADSREMAHELQNNIRKLTDALYQQQRVQRQLSEAVLGLRLTPVGELVPRSERIVRETCRKTGKQVDIDIQGQELQADTDIVKGLTEPLLHLLRNAVDHGIETTEQRLASGKPETGSIKLHFSQAGNHVTLVVQDDGAGMDPQQIRQRALKRGLLSAEQQLSDDALLRLVLLPGFSTRDEVSEVSGRGVGMDVVQAAIEKLRGTLRISSTPGQGTTFTLNLPQTLIATHALIVRAGGNHLAIPADSVEQLLYVSADESIVDEQGWRIETERYQLPVLKLADVLHWDSGPVAEAGSYTLLIVRSEINTYALYVEEILPSRDIVINSLAPWLNSIHSVQGACILANGAVAPVMDMIRLLHELEEGSLTPRSSAQDVALPGMRKQMILVVDDSLSNRKSMRLMLEAMGYSVQTAVDGMDALKLMNSLEVDLVLTDLEMPRMNGLEMTQAIRIWPEMKHLPIIMITSRGTQKHRKLAAEAGVDGYLTKPVQTELLEQEVQNWLGTQMNSGRTDSNDNHLTDKPLAYAEGSNIDG
ncbi:MAG: hybrid sensor histidine kinase/response regulator [Thiolinea sp.]